MQKLKIVHALEIWSKIRHATGCSETATLNSFELVASIVDYDSYKKFKARREKCL
jgi:hypothetical protein